MLLDNFLNPRDARCRLAGSLKNPLCFGLLAEELFRLYDFGGLEYQSSCRGRVRSLRMHQLSQDVRAPAAIRALPVPKQVEAQCQQIACRARLTSSAWSEDKRTHSSIFRIACSRWCSCAPGEAHSVFAAEGLVMLFTSSLEPRPLLPKKRLKATAVLQQRPVFQIESNQEKSSNLASRIAC